MSAGNTRHVGQREQKRREELGDNKDGAKADYTRIKCNVKVILIKINNAFIKKKKKENRYFNYSCHTYLSHK